MPVDRETLYEQSGLVEPVVDKPSTIPPPEPTKQETVSPPLSTPAAKPEPPKAEPAPLPKETPAPLIFGKYKTIEDAEKAHKDLERRFHALSPEDKEKFKSLSGEQPKPVEKPADKLPAPPNVAEQIIQSM